MLMEITGFASRRPAASDGESDQPSVIMYEGKKQLDIDKLHSELEAFQNDYGKQSPPAQQEKQVDSGTTAKRSYAWLENSPVCTKILDADFNLQYMSSAGVKALKINRIEEYYGKPYPFEFFPESARKEVTDLLQKVKNECEVITGETPVYDVDGQRLSFQSTFTRINHENGEFNYIMAVSTEITQRKRAEAKLKETIDELHLTNEELKKSKEKAEESERLKTSFLANVSHEIRTPLNAILGFTDLLNTSQDLNQDESRQCLDLIGTSGERLLRIINDIVDISRIDTEQLPLHEEDCNLNELIDSVKHGLSIHSESNQVSIIVKKGLPDEESLIRIDPTRLSQILSNLVENALKFTREGNVEFGYRIKDQRILFTVKDSGCGIHPDDHQKIFKRFWQTADNTLKKGSGLGLAIVKELVEIMGGTIWVESAKNEGATFHVEIPHRPAGAAKAGATETDSAQSAPETRHTILIAEDETPNFTYLNMLLKNHHCRILHAKNGEEAVAFVKNESVDLVLMDVRMPLMNGFEATREIRRIRPNLSIIGQSAQVLPENIAEGLECGMTEYLEKPIKAAQLLSVVEKYLSASDS